MDLIPNRSWHIRNAPSDIIEELEHELSLSHITARILAIRGITCAEQANRFIHKRLKDLSPPELMLGMDRAAQRFAQAIREQQNILIHGDFDVDGSTACSLLCLFAQACNSTATAWIPHRRIEGYGLSEASLKAVKEHQANLMITVDCGIADHGWAQKIEQETACDVIITDHHLPQHQLPQCTAIVNPNQPDCPYPDKGLAGVGVAWKLCWATAKILSGGDKVTSTLRDFLLDHLSLVAVGTVADCAPLDNENRILVHHGLKCLRHTKNLGLRALIQEAGIADKDITASDIGWKIGPLVNASGRLGSAMRNVELFCSKDQATADRLIKEIVEENEERKRLTGLLSDELIEEIKGNPIYRKRSTLVFAGERWHQGIVGIVASRIVDQFQKPCAIIGIDGDIGKGSLRTINQVHLGHAVDACREHLISGGGHAMAAGITIQQDQVDAFMEAFEDHVRNGFPNGLPNQGTDYDACVSIPDLNDHFFEELGLLEPFGQHNPEPTLLLNQVRFVTKPNLFGKTGDHLRGAITDHHGGIKQLLAWRAKEQFHAFSRPGGHFNFIIKPQLNYFRGEHFPQLLYIDGESC